MLLTSLLLRNFRNHADIEMTFSPKVNLIIGDNGIGKTNILEAIYFLSTGRSFRTSQLTDLIRHGCDHFYLEANFTKEDVSQCLKVGYDGKKRKIEYNASNLYAFSNLLGIIPSVLYSPKDISLIIGAPVERRRFLNLYLGQSDPLYVHYLLRYTKALEHRNAILKRKSLNDVDEIECFEKEMANASVYLMIQRKNALEALEKGLSSILFKLTQKKEIFTIRYQPSFSIQKELSKEGIELQYKKQRKKELILGVSLIGPHRDDFSISLEGQLIKTFCSEGQKRAFLSALKIAEWSLLKERHLKDPLMCIDDLGIHLDETRHVLLEQGVKDLGQVFLTSPRNEFSYGSSSECKIFELK
jgi:DNA replication and repair protein RecF